MYKCKQCLLHIWKCINLLTIWLGLVYLVVKRMHLEVISQYIGGEGGGGMYTWDIHRNKISSISYKTCRLFSKVDSANLVPYTTFGTHTHTHTLMYPVLLRFCEKPGIFSQPLGWRGNFDCLYKWSRGDISNHGTTALSSSLGITSSTTNKLVEVRSPRNVTIAEKYGVSFYKSRFPSTALSRCYLCC